jgi:hypothetical protein
VLPQRADHFPIEEVHTAGSGPVDLRLEPGTRVRVTGALSADPARGGRAELHPVYRVDVLQDFARRPAGAELTGAWQADDGGTYFIRQAGNELWWLGMSRDLGAEFFTVFRGTIGPDGIDGDWSDVSGTRGRSHGTLSLACEPAGPLALALTATARTGGTGASNLAETVRRAVVAPDLNTASRRTVRRGDTAHRRPADLRTIWRRVGRAAMLLGVIRHTIRPTCPPSSR